MKLPLPHAAAPRLPKAAAHKTPVCGSLPAVPPALAADVSSPPFPSAVFPIQPRPAHPALLPRSCKRPGRSGTAFPWPHPRRRFPPTRSAGQNSQLFPAAVFPAGRGDLFHACRRCIDGNSLGGRAGADIPLTGNGEVSNTEKPGRILRNRGGSTRLCF